MANSQLFTNFLDFYNNNNVIISQTAISGLGSGTNPALSYGTQTLLTRTGISSAQPTSITTDNIGNIYMSGCYSTSSVVNVYNLSGTLAPFQLPNTSNTNTNFIIKYDQFGNANSWTTFGGAVTLKNYLSFDQNANLYWVGNYLASVGNNPILNFSTNSATTSSYSIVSPVTSGSNVFIIKYSSNNGTVISWTFLDNLNISSAEYCYWSLGSLYVLLLYTGNLNIRDYTTSNNIIGTISGTSTQNCAIINYYYDNFKAVSILTGSSTNIFTIVSDSNYIYVGGYVGSSCQVFSFGTGSTIGQTSILANPSSNSIIARYNIADGSINSVNSLNTGIHINYMTLSNNLLYTIGWYNTNSSSLLSNLNGGAGSLSLPSSSSTNYAYSVIYQTDTTGTAYKINIIYTLLSSLILCIRGDQLNNIYIYGIYANSTIITDYYTTSTTASNSLILPTPTGVGGYSNFIIKYNSNGIATSFTTFNSFVANTNGVFYIDQSGNLYLAGSQITGPNIAYDFTTTGYGTPRFTMSSLSGTCSFLLNWTNNGLLNYIQYPALQNVQLPVNTNDVVDKQYVDGTFEYIQVSGSVANNSPNIISILRPPEIDLNNYSNGSNGSNPIMYNSSPSGLIIDTFNNYVYVSGTYYGPNVAVFSKDGTYAFDLPNTNNVSSYIIKYSNTGQALSCTTLVVEVSGSLAIDTYGFVYFSGSYNNTTGSVSTGTGIGIGIGTSVYDFSSSSVVGLSKAVLPIGCNQFIIKWSSQGIFDSFSASESWSSASIGANSNSNNVGPTVAIDTSGNIYGAINNIVSNVSNFTNNGSGEGNGLNNIQNSSTFGIGLGTISPWTQTGQRLVGTGATGNAQQGYQVSSYENTFITGGYNDNNGTGAAWVFVRGSNGLWSQQGTKLVGSGTLGSFATQQGSSVSIYGDTVAIGGNYDNNHIGAVWIFVRNGTTWTQQQKLVGTGYTGTNVQQGVSVSLYQDTVAFGGYIDNNSIGATWVFTRDTTGLWSQQGSKLVGSGTVGSICYQGIAVSLYQNTLAIGGYGDNGSIGATWIFNRTWGSGGALGTGASGGVWTQQGPKLVGTGYINTPNQGAALSLYQNTLAIGGRQDNSGVGGTWIFVSDQYGNWTQQGPKLLGTGHPGNDQQGWAVSLYQDTLAVGGPNDNSNIGALWIFIRSGGNGGSVWTQQGNKIVCTDVSGNVVLGNGVSLYKNTIVAGAYLDNSTGTNWVFTNNTTGLAKWNPYNGIVSGLSPIQNFITTSLKIDSNNNVYCAGTINNGISSLTVYNISYVGDQSNSTLVVPQTSGGSAIIKWSSLGSVSGFTFLSGVQNPMISIDSNNNIYCTGNYISSNTVPVYNFNNGSNTMSPFSLPIASTQTTFIIKWVSDGMASSFNILQGSIGSGNNLGITNDFYGNVYLSTNYSSTSTVPVYNFVGSTGSISSAHSNFSLPATLSTQTNGLWVTTGSTSTTKLWSASVLLNNGQVLVAGGTTATSASFAIPTSVSELYNPLTGAWTTTGSLTVARLYCQGSLLQNSNVLVAGGFTSGTIVATSIAEIYNINTGTWSTTGSMNLPRGFFALAPLYTGKILAMGGYTAGATVSTSACELYDPGLGTWETTGAMAIPRANNVQYNTLPNGQIIVISGTNSLCEIYNPVTGLWAPTGSLYGTTITNFATEALQDGKVLVTGGTSGSGSYVYNPVSGTWNFGIPAPTTANISYATATLIPNGQVLLAGGSITGSSATQTSNSYLFNQFLNSWTTTGSLNFPRSAAMQVLLKTGSVLVFGGTTASAISELYSGSGISNAIIKWLPNGVASSYQTFPGTSGTNQLVYNPGLAVDQQGFLNYVASTGCTVPVYNMNSTGSTSTIGGSSTVGARYTINGLNATGGAEGSEMPCSTILTKWNGAGSVDLSPYTQNFYVNMAPGQPGTSSFKKIITDTQGYNYQLSTNNYTEILGNKFNMLYWNGSYWST